MFGFHPVNLALRFILELAALGALAMGGYGIASSPFSWILAIGFPIAGAAAWATFNVPGDRSRSGEAPVPVPGIVRLIVELNLFGVAAIVVWFTSPTLSIGLIGLVIIHYSLSTDRIRWLLAN